MFESIKRFFRRRAINKFLKRKRTCIMPDVKKFPSIILLIDQKHQNQVGALIQTANTLFGAKRCSVFVLCNQVTQQSLSNENIIYISKADFGFFGLLKSDKQSLLDSLSSDLFINLCISSSENLEDDYLVTCFKSSFRMTFLLSNFQALYDMKIDPKRDTDIISRLMILVRYLKVLNGYE